jgi:hypothetical protein
MYVRKERKKERNKEEENKIKHVETKTRRKEQKK